MGKLMLPWGCALPVMDFLAGIPGSWLLTGWVLKGITQSQYLRHTSRSIWATEAIMVLKATPTCESSAEYTGGWNKNTIYIKVTKELLNNSLQIPNFVFQLHSRFSKINTKVKAEAFQKMVCATMQI